MINRHEHRMRALAAKPHFKSENGQSVVPSEREIADIERVIGYSLPAEYRDFLRVYSGYRISPSANFSVRTVGDGGHQHIGNIHQFFGVRSGSPYDLLEAYESFTRRGWELPTWMLPVATDGGNNLVCIALTGNDRGKIFHWIADVFPGKENCFEVTDSFHQFIDLLELMVYDE